MTAEELYQQLLALGVDIGRAKSGNLLRVDCRQGQSTLDHETLTHVCQIATLRELYLWQQTGLDEVLQSLSDWPRFQALDLQGSDLSDQSLRLLANLSSLERLNICNTPTSESTIAELRKRMIRTRIISR